MKLRRKRYVMDPDQREHPLVQQREALLKREAALGDELAGIGGGLLGIPGRGAPAPARVVSGELLQHLDVLEH